MTDLIYETQHSFYQYIERVAAGTQMIADYLREDKVGEAMQLITQFSEGVVWLTKVIALMQQHQYDIRINPNQINEFLLEINDGLERQDYIIVADMFEYEIKPFFEEAAKERFYQKEEEN
ncbi:MULTISPECIES: hypothetical protein [Geobacillus]|uniref:Uncharacterized protein n=1 Tax=Geobacillus subterraneus TaxID=129338 RepID=A0A679FXU5_9BACL|nr:MULTISPECIES: hypothetical protein [Geobacillus]NNV07374.1 hypothetical protein [Geobacillus sp. MMMUD3]TWG31882.1 hypothetical protein GC56T2_3138 [Geobacillus sp. C56-T2]BBW97634.1 hypothetical protein GsuE55_24670 [Geobacillus subterraneus]